MSDAIAQAKGELVGDGCVPLQSEGASAQPFVLGHAEDEDLLGCGGGLVFVHELLVKGAEFFFRLILE